MDLAMRFKGDTAIGRRDARTSTTAGSCGVRGAGALRIGTDNHDLYLGVKDRNEKPTRRVLLRELRFARCFLRSGGHGTEVSGGNHADTTDITLRQNAQQRRQVVWVIRILMLLRK